MGSPYRTPRHGLGGAELVVISERKRACPVCKRPFLQREGWRITCSQDCRTKYIADWPHEIDEVIP